MVESNIGECHVAHACIRVSGRDRANCHANTKVNFDISNDDIFGTLRNRIGIVRGFDCDCVVVVGNFDALNQDVLGSRVNTISIKWVGWHSQNPFFLKPKEFGQVHLAPHIDPDLHIMEVKAIAVIGFNMELWGILPFDSSVLN